MKDNNIQQSPLTESAQFAQFAWAKILSKQTSFEHNNDEAESSPLIPASLYMQLPELLKEGSFIFNTDRERDVFLTGALTILSGCFSNVFGIYDKKEVSPNLYCFIVAPAASGKGVLIYAKQLGMKIHNKLIEESKSAKDSYTSAMKRFQSESKKKHTSPLDLPIEPPQKLLFIPANSSAANVIKLLEQNSGAAIICETEADTMTHSFKQDWGGYSDLLRKAFHNEPVTLSRKKDSEFTELNKPKLSVSLTGTPSQVGGLIASSEDGLFSRFIFYNYKAPHVWRDVSDKEGINYNTHFDRLSAQVFDISERLKGKNIEFKLSDNQWDWLNSYHEKCLHLIGDEMSSSVIRSGLITYRIAMVLTILRNANNLCSDCQLFCDDIDLKSAISLSDIYLAHDMLAYKLLLTSKGKKLDGNKMKLYQALPASGEFSRLDALKIAATLSIKERTLDKYLSQCTKNNMLESTKFGWYRKVDMQNVQTMQIDETNLTTNNQNKIIHNEKDTYSVE